MNTFSRGVKNAFRNKLRFGAVVLILAIGIGLALSMLVANQAVKDRIAELKSDIGTALTVSPAGSRGFEGGGEPLTSSELQKIEDLDHVESASASMTVRVQNEDSSTTQTQGMNGMGGGRSMSSGTTSLESAIDAGTLGNRNQNSNTDDTISMPSFSLPITITGTDSNVTSTGSDITITSGRLFADDDSDKNVALVGSSLAEKNNLEVGSTFTVFDEEVTVIGIFNQENTFDNGGLYLPLETTQRLSDQSGEIGTILVQVDSVDNIESVQSAITNSLGENVVDVSSSSTGIETAIASLESVQRISIIGFIASLISAGVIIFMIMLVIVRERRREIGVLKAIGASNRTVIGQFMSESIVLIICGALAGIVVAFAASSPIANALVSSNASSTSQSTTAPSRDSGGAMPGGFGRAFGAQPGNRLGTVESNTDLVGKVTANIGAQSLLLGLAAAIIIAIIGSAIPAWLTAKVRPSEVMRGE